MIAGLSPLACFALAMVIVIASGLLTLGIERIRLAAESRQGGDDR